MAGNNIDRLLHVYSEANAADPDTLSFWSEEIRKFCMKNGTVAFSVETLVKSYTVNDIYPSSCETAVRLLAERKQGIDRKADVLVGELDVVQGLLSALSLLSRNQSSNNKELFVCTALLDTVADRLIRHVSVLDERDSVVFVDRERGCPLEFTFAGLVHRPGLHESTKVSTLDEVDVLMSRLTDDEVNVLLKYMVKQQRAVLSEDGKVVKVLRNRPAQPKSASLITTIWGGISSVISSPGAAAPRVLNEADVAALYLKHSIRQVEDRIEALRVNSADLLRKAKVAKVGATLLCSYVDSGTGGYSNVGWCCHYAQSAGEDKLALVYLGMRRSRDQARNRLLQSLVGLVEAQEVWYTSISCVSIGAYYTT